MIARAGAPAFAALLLAACGDNLIPAITIADDGVVYAAWQDGDGPWRRAALATPLPVVQEHHAVAIACDGAARLWLYRATEAPLHEPTVADYGCDANASAISARLWFVEPAPGDPSCAWADPPGTCPPLLSVAVTVTGDGGDPIVITSLRSSEVIFESPTEARLFDPALARGEQAVTVAAHHGAAYRSLTQDAPPRLPFVLPGYALPPPIGVAVTRERATWDRPIGRAFVELRTARFAIRATSSEPWFATAVELPVIDPATLPGWDPAYGAFAPGETVTWQVDLFDLGDAAGPTRAGGDGALTW